MRTRTIAGFALMGIMFVVLFFAPPWTVPLSISIISALAIHELLYTTGFIRGKKLITYAVVTAFIVPIWAFFGSNSLFALGYIFIFVFLLFIESITAGNMSFEKISGIFFAGTIIPYFFTSVSEMYFLPNGRFLVLLPILAAFSSDVFALLFGLKFGKRKLSPSISPNKTVEGSVGGLLMAPVILCIYGYIIYRSFNFDVDYLRLVLYGLVGAFAGQIGDLSMSFIKREFKIKDFGSLIPGHGGILDRFDSILFAAPLIYVLFQILPAISR